MRRSTFLLCAAIIGLAACGSDDVENAKKAAADAANTATNAAENAANTAASDAANAANTAASDAANAANAAANTAETAAADAANAADTAVADAENAAADGTDAAGRGGGRGIGKGRGRPGPIRIAPRTAEQVAFRGCPTVVPVSRPGTCLIVRSGGQTYDISSARPRPGTGSVIQGTGIYDRRTVGVCMSGKALTNIRWSSLRGLCPRR